jgi:uncharacterized protein with von Willebrand factor type A (vWA) domain
MKQRYGSPYILKMDDFRNKMDNFLRQIETPYSAIKTTIYHIIAYTFSSHSIILYFHSKTQKSYYAS